MGAGTPLCRNDDPFERIESDSCLPEIALIADNGYVISGLDVKS